MKSLLMSIVLVCLGSLSQAATFTANIWQSGSDLQFAGAGTLDTTGLTKTNTFTLNLLRSFDAVILFGGTSVDSYQVSMTGPASMGGGSSFILTDTSGPSAGIWASAGVLYTPAGYRSGDYIKNSAALKNKTLADVSLNVGTYTWTFGANTFNVVVGTAPVPVPASLPLLAGGVLAFAALRRRGKARLA